MYIVNIIFSAVSCCRSEIVEELLKRNINTLIEDNDGEIARCNTEDEQIRKLLDRTS